MKQYNGKKRDIQKYFYQRVGESNSVTALAGNNLDLHINDILPIISHHNNRAYIYDMCENVIKKFNYLTGLYSKVRLLNSNIALANPTQFIDLDLMRTLDTEKGLIYYMFEKQYNKFYKSNIYYNKWITFMFTYCLRNNNTKLEDFIMLLLSDKDIEVFYEYKTYKDGAPMCTCQIRWRRTI